MPTDIPVYVDAPDSTGGSVFDDVGARSDGRRGAASRLVEGSYEHALTLAEEAVRQAARRFAALGRAVRPDEIEMAFGVTVNLEGHVGIAKASTEAQFLFTFRWNTSPQDGRADRAEGSEEEPERLGSGPNEAHLP